MNSTTEPGGILIFLPGVQDIRLCIEAMRGLKNAKIFPLHANLSNDEQRAVFEPTLGWKVIAATNVAEVSPECAFTVF
jgi:ATP-dependent RNA helicase DHX57